MRFEKTREERQVEINASADDGRGIRAIRMLLNFTTDLTVSSNEGCEKRERYSLQGTEEVGQREGEEG